MSDLMTEEEIFEEENKRREEDELYKFYQSLCDAVDVVARNDIAPPKEVAFTGIWFFSQMMYAIAPNKEAADETIEVGVEYGYELDKNQILSSENEALKAENKRLSRELKTKGNNEEEL